MFDLMRQPIIIIGMHRSGTSLLTRVLREQGFFMGRDTDHNDESALFRALNAWLFRQASATWDRPEGVLDLLQQPAILDPVEDYLSGILQGPSQVRYLGLYRYLAGGLNRLQTPWGWKDPRNTYTLPLWLRLFPDARIVHIQRHGVDVAASLVARRSAAVNRSLARYTARRHWYVRSPWAPKRSGFAHQLRCATLTGSLELWVQYLQQARQVIQACPDGTCLTITYEDLLQSPGRTLQDVMNFCGITAAAPDELTARVLNFDVQRAFAYRRDPELQSFAEAHQASLHHLGFAP